MTESNSTATTTTSLGVSPTILPNENPEDPTTTISPTPTITDCIINHNCSLNAPLPIQTFSPEAATLSTERSEIPIPTLPPITTNSTDSNINTNDQSFSTTNLTTIFVIVPIVFAIISLIIGIIIYKRTHKKRQEGTILQFEPMHPHVVVVDADGNSLGKRNSFSNNSFTGGSIGR